MNYANDYKMDLQHIKMFKYSSAKYYQNNKEKLQKKASERYQSPSKEEKEKTDSMVVNDTKVYQKMKNKSLLTVEKNIKWENMSYYNYKKYLF